MTPSSVMQKPQSVTDLLMIAYEERNGDGEEESSVERRAEDRRRQTMHQYIPATLFKVTVRRAPRSKTSSGIDGSASDETGAQSVGMNYASEETITMAVLDSPTSFPSTPFSRARVITRSAERTDNVVFAARDSLRLQVQSCSQDPFSRSAAAKAKHHHQFAVFDSTNTSDGLALTCGNHCVMKVGGAVCGSTRAMMPISEGQYVYLEYSIMTSANQLPSLALGFSTPDCPLGCMVR